jgi:serine/threonine protein kinase/tetratricopeptide (TPR) repeat protein
MDTRSLSESLRKSFVLYLRSDKGLLFKEELIESSLGQAEWKQRMLEISELSEEQLERYFQEFLQSFLSPFFSLFPQNAPQNFSSFWSSLSSSDDLPTKTSLNLDQAETRIHPLSLDLEKRGGGVGQSPASSETLTREGSGGEGGMVEELADISEFARQKVAEKVGSLTLLAQIEADAQHTSVKASRREEETAEKGEEETSSRSVSSAVLEGISKEAFETDTRYQVLQILGEGGMGVVQRVYDKLLGREVALKRIKVLLKETDSLSQQQWMLWRLRREASITAVLEHPNIVPLYDMSKGAGDELYFTMQKIEGKTLQEILMQRKNQGGIEERKLLSIFLKVGDAVAYAHAKGVIHRDLKPSNIMVGAFGEVYVVDWGIAKIVAESEEIRMMAQMLKKEQDTENLKTQGGIGTPGYFSPEQKKNASQITFQSDIYTLGKILKELYLGMSPLQEFRYILKAYEKQKTERHQGASPQKPFRKAFWRYWKRVHKRQVLEKSGQEIEEELKALLPKDIQAIVDKATQNEPHKRYEKVQHLSEDIERYLEYARVSVRKYSWNEALHKWVKRHYQKVLVGLTFLLLCFSFLGYFHWKSSYERKKAFEEEWKQAQTYESSAQKQKDSKEAIQPLLKAFLHINRALRLQQEETLLAEKKMKIAHQLILFCCRAQDYQLAYYVVDDLYEGSFYLSPEHLAFRKTVENHQKATLLQHQERFAYWKRVLKEEISISAEKQALLEMSKMQEEEIFPSFVALVEEGTQYFDENKMQQDILDNYYRIFATALGNLEKPQAGVLLLQQLEKLSQKYSFSQIARNPQYQRHLEFMVALAESLANSKAFEYCFAFQEIRQRMAEDEFFWIRTSEAYRRLSLGSLAYYQQQIQEKKENAHLYYSRGLVYTTQKAYTLARNDYNLALHYKKNSPEVYHARGSAYFLEGEEKLQQGETPEEEFRQALCDFNQAILLDPQFYKAYRARGALYLKQAAYTEALNDFNFVLQNQGEKDPFVLNNRGLVRWKLKDLEGAFEDLSVFIQLHPCHAYAYNNRGVLSLELKKYENAFQDFCQALRLHPGYGEAYQNRAYVKQLQNDYEGALLDYTEAIRLQPQLFKNYFNRAELKIKQKDWKGALADYSQSLQLNPQNAEIYERRAELYEREKRFEEAFWDYSQAIRLDPENPYYWHRRAEFLLKQQEKTEAILEDIQNALQRKKDFPEAYLLLTRFHLWQKNKEKAQESLQEVFRLQHFSAEAYFFSRRTLSFTKPF